MAEIIALIKAFLAHTISADDFAMWYLKWWNEIREEQDKAVNEAGLRDSFISLGNQFDSKSINLKTYETRWQHLVDKVGPCTVKIGSPEDEFISTLMVTVDAYEGDPEIRGDDYLNEEQFRQEVIEKFTKFCEDYSGC
jgi:hypothetical protein